ncbi:NUDIX domain-containing protein [Streptomyces sp. CBMA152]|uniref:NUDIX domain-containing protein n=1 Tax=Streptomyces sp. CBMA152 TaxID=1896312 RepID=UPI0016617984|nr:NUDIX domain-containing protein [Streptomyces sp. CBMA152]MBD0742976.1 hypothetical protein [Streptomyces sp. CBMA152]
MSDAQTPVIFFAGIILENRDGHVLMMRRANTGFADGQWSLPGGRVDPGELAVQAAAREANEEVAADVQVNDLRTVHVINKVGEKGEPIVGWYFHTRWEGPVRNAETHRCSELSWTHPRTLAQDTEETDRAALTAWLRGETTGWL